MTNKKSTKRALLLSALSLLLCVSMLVGSTFAWFTDSVTSGNNIIKSGNLDVELEYKKVDDGKVSTEWTSVKDKTDIFNPDALWEPGHVEVVYLKVSNLGTLALKYQLGVNVIKETLGKTEAGADIKLSDHLVFKTLLIEEGDVGAYNTRESAITAAGTVKGLTDYNGTTTALEVGGEDYVALIVYMPETVGNEANYRGTDIPTIELGINLFATQFTAEEDSFDELYDKNAWHKSFKVYNANDLQNAINAGEANITLMDNIEAAEAVEIPEGATVELDLGGKTISADTSYAFENKGDLTISGEGTISGLGGIRSTAGKLTINGGAYFGASDWNNGTYQHTLKAENTVVEINGGIFDATVNGQTNAMINVSNGTTMTINGGTFKNVSGDLSNFDPYLFHYEGDGKLIINNGDFYGGWRFASNDASTDIYGGTFAITTDGQSFQAGNTHTLKVYGGTFTFGKDATKTAVLARVADNFKAVDNGNGTYTVIPAQVDGKDLNLFAGYPGLYTDGTNFYIYDAVGLKSANELLCSSSGRYTLGFNRTYNIMADIDATGVVWNAAWLEGSSGNETGMAFEGNGKMISNLSINGSLLNGAAYGAVIQNVIFDNALVTSAGHHVGVIWGQVYGDLTLKNVTVKNSSVTGLCNVSALVGATAVDNATVTYTGCSVENTTIKATGVFSGAEGDWASDPNGANIYMGRAYGASKLVFSDNASVGNTIIDNETLADGGIYGYTTLSDGWWAGTGVCDSFTNWNGISVVTENTNAALADAIESGASQVVMPAGSYSLPTTSSNVTISGTRDTVITVDKPKANKVTLKGVTVVGSGLYTGIQHSDTVIFEDCALKGMQCLYANKVEFKNCTFDANGKEHNIWTYGAKNVSFTDCDFTYGDRSVNVYTESAAVKAALASVSFERCTFTTDNTASKGAVEINSSVFTNKVNVSFVDCTAPAYGTMVGISGWDGVNGANANVTVDGAAFAAPQWAK